MGKKNRKKIQQQQQSKRTILTDIQKDESTKWTWYPLILVAIVTLGIYFRAIQYDLLYSWDDNIYVRNNLQIRHLNWENIKLFFSSFYVDNYQPVSMLSYAIDYLLGSGKPNMFHFTNIFLHLVNTVLVFILIRKISPESKIAAIFTSAFFAIHPMHVESVAWVAERKDVLYSFFFLLSLIIYMQYINSLKPKLLIYTALLFILSCLSKSAAVILPLVLLILDYYTGRKFHWRVFIEKAPFFVVSLIFGLVAIHSQKNSLTEMAPSISVIEHISIVCYSISSYLFKLFIPVNLSAIYTYPVELGSTLPMKYYLSVFLVAAVIGFVFYSRKWGKDIIFGFLFFITTIILVLQFVQVGIASMADRYTYIPYIGILFVIGRYTERFTIEKKLSSSNKKFIFTFVILIFAVFSFITNERIKIWKTDETLFTDVIEKYPNCALPYNGRGTYYLNFYANHKYANDKVMREAFLNKAQSDFNNSLKFKTSPMIKVDIFYNSAVTKASLGNYSGAIKDFDEAIKIDSNYVSAYMNRGGAKLMLKDFEGALKDCTKAISLNPNDPVVIQNRNILDFIKQNIHK